MLNRYPRRGEVYYIDIPQETRDGNSVQQGYRPAVIVSNDRGNKHAPVIIVAPLTTAPKHNLPTHVTIPSNTGVCVQDSSVLCEQLLTVDKKWLRDYCGIMPHKLMCQIDRALIASVVPTCDYTPHRRRDKSDGWIVL